MADIFGTNGNDDLVGSTGDDTIHGGAGNDNIDGNGGHDDLFGDEDDDFISVRVAANVDGGSGNDTLRLIDPSGMGPFDNGYVIDLRNSYGGLLDQLGTWLVTGIENVSGGSRVDLVYGNGASNILAGEEGADILRGGDGDDLLLGDGSLRYSAGQIVVTRTGVGAGNDVLDGQGGNDVVVGGGGDDFLLGGAGNDQLEGDEGIDSLNGGTGDDILDGGAGFDRASYSHSDPALGGATVSLLLQGTAQNTGSGGIDTLIGIENLGGTPFSDSLTGDDNSNWLSGGGPIDVGGVPSANNDMLDGRGGDDLLTVAEGNHTLVGGSGIDTVSVASASPVALSLALQGAAQDSGIGSWTLTGIENLSGFLGADQLTGDDNANVLAGDEGSDTLTGGGGDDVLLGDGAILANASDSQNIVIVESLFLSSPGNDILDGGTGNDRMVGGRDNDIYYVDSAGDVVVEQPGEGIDEIRTGIFNYSLETRPNVENLTALTSTGQVLTGNGANNVLTGGGGNDVFEGLGGDDVMKGGAGDDQYVVNSAGDVMVELAGEGTDWVRTALAVFSLVGTNVENLSIVGDSFLNRDFRGNGSDNVISGGRGFDFFRLQDGGDDDVTGGEGDDTFLFGATLTAADKVNGGAGRDQIAIQGDYSGGITLGSNIIGIDSLAIMPGSDTRFGDPGTSFYSYNIIVLDAATIGGTLVVVDANRLRLGENLTFDGSADLDGNFFIYGGKGTDTLTGGAGNDTFYFGENGQFGASDHVDGGPGGTDQLGLRGNYTITFGADQLVSIESIGMVSAQDTRFGSLGTTFNYNLTMVDANLAAGVQMTVDAAPLRPNETLTFDGSAELDGSFRIFGGKGNDVLTGSQGSDIIRAGEGNDTVNGGGGNDDLDASYGNDILDGGDGNDLLSGFLGADSLRGGAGDDVFKYVSESDSTAAAFDIIQDFSTGDRINLTQIDADSGGPPNTAFTFIGSSAFSHTAGELRAAFDAGSNAWIVQGDVNGDGVADLQISVVSDHPIAAADFIL